MIKVWDVGEVVILGSLKGCLVVGYKGLRGF